MSTKILIRPLTDNYDCHWIKVPIRKNFTDILNRKTQIYDRYEYWYPPTSTFWRQFNPKNKDDFEYGIELKDGLVLLKTYDEARKLANYAPYSEVDSKDFTIIDDGSSGWEPLDELYYGRSEKVLNTSSAVEFYDESKESFNKSKESFNDNGQRYYDTANYTREGTDFRNVVMKSIKTKL